MRVPTRIFAFFAKWLAEIVRQPILVVSLVAGPFFVLLAFGQGVEIGGPHPRTIVVWPQQSDELAADLLPADGELADFLDVVTDTTDLEWARAQVETAQVDAVLVLPTNPAEYLRQGQRIPLRVITGAIDPVRLSYANAFLRDQVAELNQRTIRRAIDQARGSSGFALHLESASLDAFDIEKIESGTIAAPFQLEVEQGLAFAPTFTQFYAPALLALILQHLGVTLGALSMTRMRLLNLVDLLRVAPVRATEVVLGQYVSYGLLTALIGGALLLLIHFGLDVPVLGSWFMVVAIGMLLTLASLGLGLVLSLVSPSEQQAVQLSMLVFLASIFFAGFAFTLDRIDWPVKAISFALPATYGIRAFQDAMLRGVTPLPVDVAVLGAAALVLFVATVLLMKREFRPG